MTVDIDGVADDGSASDQSGSLRDNVQTDVENLTGSPLADILRGGAANNVLDGGAGADTLGGLGGTDTVSYAARTTAVMVDIDGVADDGNADDGPAAARDNVQSDVEDLVGGSAADTLAGSAASNTLDGGAGADSLSGLGGVDTVSYATRTIAVTVDIDGVADDGSASDQSGSLRDNVQTDVENLTGSPLADTLAGGAADNVLDGGAGADALSGLGGVDTVSYATRTIAVTVDIDDVGDDGSASDQSGSLRDNVQTDVENLIGSPLGDTLTGSGAANVLTGGLGADSFNAGAGNDTINARNDDVDSSFQCGESASDTDTANADSTPNDPVTPGATNCEVVNKA